MPKYFMETIKIALMECGISCKTSYFFFCFVIIQPVVNTENIVFQSFSGQLFHALHIHLVYGGGGGLDRSF